MTKIALTATLSIRPDQLDAFVAELRDHAAKTLAGEEGSILFEAHASVDDPNRIMLYEVYADADALVAHRENPQLAKFRAATADMVIERVVKDWAVM